MHVINDPEEFYHRQYYSLNIGAHRKGGMKLETPTIARHLGFWFSVRASDSSESRKKLLDSTIIETYEKCCMLDGFDINCRFDLDDKGQVLGLFNSVYCIDNKVLHSGDHYAQYSGVKDYLASDNRIIEVSFAWKGMPAKIRIELHTEYFTMSTYLTPRSSDKSDRLGGPIGSLIDLASIRRTESDDLTINKKIENTHEFLYENLWGEFFDECIASFKTLRIEASKESRLDAEIFCDFRGLVIFTDEQGFNPNARVTGNINKSKTYDDEWPRKELFPKFWSFLLCRKELSLHKREFTASFMLDKRAIYISALGPQPSVAGKTMCAPLHYLIFVRPSNKWQLGRLLDKVHHLGTLRLAALMELEKLRLAGRNLKKVESQADQARQAIYNKDTKKAVDHFNKINRLLSHQPDEPDLKFWSGLLYRVERSRYYVGLFESGVKQLRIDRIEGFQPYDVFVRARLGRTYDYIDRLGKRQERAVSNSASIFQAISVLENIEINEKIGTIQIKAEFVLFVFLVPYYLLGIAHYSEPTLGLEFVSNSIVEVLIVIILTCSVISGVSSLLELIIPFIRKTPSMFWRKFSYMLSIVVFAVITVYAFNQSLQSTPSLKTGKEAAPLLPKDHGVK